MRVSSFTVLLPIPTVRKCQKAPGANVNVWPAVVWKREAAMREAIVCLDTDQGADAGRPTLGASGGLQLVSR